LGRRSAPRSPSSGGRPSRCWSSAKSRAQVSPPWRPPQCWHRRRCWLCTSRLANRLQHGSWRRAHARAAPPRSSVRRRAAWARLGSRCGFFVIYFLFLFEFFFVCLFSMVSPPGKKLTIGHGFVWFFLFFFFFFWNFRKCERSLTDPRLAALVAVAIAEFTARDPYRFPAHTDAMRSAWHEWEACAGGWSELQELAEAARGLRAHSFFFRFVWF
jgi:hypothetical protein